MKSGCRALVALLLAGALAGGPAAPPLWAQEQAAAQPSQKVTLQMQGVEIVEILKMLAEQAGFNLVAGRNVSGRVTLFVKEVDPWEALEVILAANELAYEKRGSILTILTQRDYEQLYGQPFAERRVLKSFVPQHAKAADIGRSLATTVPTTR